MTPHMNAIPSAELRSLFPGVDRNLPLELSSLLFGTCYKTSRYSHKVSQIFRTESDDMPEALLRHKGRYDYIHIDGDHSYNGVRTDTLTALDLATHGAILTWHDFYTFPDYIAQGRERRGVYSYLNELARDASITLRHIVGTYLVVGSRAWPKDLPGVLLQPGDAEAPFGRRNLRLADTGWK
ncbi:hypothetical protein WCLP8_4580002 [uncultured Gammaproteobacteria bacterium]